MADLRREQIGALRAAPLDLLVLGGGINGAGVLRDVALRAEAGGRALRLGLIERGQFGSGTSGRNSQLIHGGLRYLKQLEVRLVRESLRERALLIELAPGLVRALPFLMPFYGRLDRLYYGAGLALYDALAGRNNIARHRRLSRRATLEGEPRLNDKGLSGGALFWDARVNAGRFVVANVFDAIERGAAAANYVGAEAWKKSGGVWRVAARDELTGERFELRARKLVDTLGPWSRAGGLRLVRGSHLVLPRLTSGDHAVAHFNRDGRILFVIPWGETRPLSLVGTTDVDHTGSPDDVRASAEEVKYLLAAVRRLFPGAKELQPISAYSALRALVPERGPATLVSREHRVWNSDDGVLHVAGGKYTTYRKMSDEAADAAAAEIAPALARLRPTVSAPLRPVEPPATWRERVGYAVQREMARRLSDLMFVSSSWGYEQQWTREGLQPLAEEMGGRLGWERSRIEEEIDRVLCQAAAPG